VNLSGRRVLIVGLGASGAAAARLAHRHGAQVAVSDAGDGETVRARLADLAGVLAAHELGGHTQDRFHWAEVIVVSPGVPLALPLFETARQAGAEVIGEVELAYAFLDVPIIGITGTKGKSTTTTLLGEMLRAAGRNVFVGGNLGTPLSEAALQESRPDVVVAELSSFQLETIHRFRSRIAALLNLAPDHQDRYTDFDDYVAAKMNLFAGQQPSDFAVLNAADQGVMTRAREISSTVFTFGSRHATAYCAGGELRLRGGGLDETIDVTGFTPPGEHNLRNLEAAALMARLAGATAEAVGEAAGTYKGLAHRLEPLGEIGGVHYFNDSKATTPGAVSVSLRAMDRPVVLILGGRDKGGQWQSLQSDIDQSTTAVLAYGEAAETIAAALTGVRIVGRMEEALDRAKALAKPGQAVLLSPGCASFDQFADFAARGEALRAWGKRQ